MKNSYPFFNRYKGKLPLVAMAVQEPTLTYTNPETKKPFTREEFVDVRAKTISGVNIIFWSAAAPWLRKANSRPDASAHAAQVAAGFAGFAGAAAAPWQPPRMTRDATTAGTACPVSRSQSCASATSFAIAAAPARHRASASRAPDP